MQQNIDIIDLLEETRAVVTPWVKALVILEIRSLRERVKVLESYIHNPEICTKKSSFVGEFGDR